MPTPVQLQYQTLKAKNPDAILFFRLGDFYEMFYEDAQLVSRILGIALTARHRGSENEMPMCGFPYHAHEEYLEKLIDQGYKVAIAEQIEDPDTGKIHREIVCVVTPGTSLESGNLESGKNSFLAGIVEGKQQWGLAYADLSTGEFRVVVVNEEESLLDELKKIMPREILLSGELYADQHFTDRLPKCHLSVKNVPTFQIAEGVLQDHFRTKNTESLGMGTESVLLQACALVMSYLRETQKIDLSHIRKIDRYAPGDRMMLDAQTFRHLEIFTPLIPDDKGATLYSVFESPFTAMGGRWLRQAIANPLLDKKEIFARQEGITEILDRTEIHRELTDQLKQVADLERILARLVANKANPRDLAWVRTSLQTFPILREMMEGAGAPILHQEKETFSGTDELVDELQKAVVDEPPLDITTGGIFREGYSAELDELRGRALGAKDWLDNFLEEKKKESGISTLKVKYSKNFGFCLEVSTAQKKNVPEGWIRRQTLMNAERYTTSELSEYEDKILSAESEAYEMEHKMFHELREKILVYTEDIQLASRAIGKIDMLLALARTAQRWRWVRPEILDTAGELFVRQGRHPVVEKLSTERFIPNDTEIDEFSHFQLITGPNMAGKSTFLRQNAIFILLAQIGSFVPAKEARLSVFDRIFTRVGASDNLAAGKSTFFVEMTEAAVILHSATERSFIILDEIGRGTSTFDGISLAWAITEFLHDQIRACTLFATHYHELIDLVEELARAKNLHVSVAQGKEEIVFLRKILPGGISDSFGIDVAKVAGLPSKVITRAKEILGRMESENLMTGPNLFSNAKVREKVVEVEKESEVEKVLRNLKPDELSPKEALELLYELRQMVMKEK